MHKILSLTLVFLGGLVAWLTVSGAPLTGMYVESNKHANEDDLRAVGTNTLEGMYGVVDGAISTVVASTRLVEKFVPEVALCDLTNGFSSTGALAGILATWTLDSSIQRLQGVGVMTFAGVESDTFDFSNKISYEVTNGTFVDPPCDEFLYGLTDNGTTYTSFCMDSNGQVTSPTVKYSGPDYGATDGERSLMLGESGNALWSPVFDLVGKQSISYERAKPRCVPAGDDGSNYAIVFSQVNLVILSDQLSQFDIDGVAFVIERATGLLVAASIPDQVVVVEGDQVDRSHGGPHQHRVAVTNATNNLIRNGGELVMANINSLSTTSLPLEGNGIVVFAQPYEYADSEAELGWVNVVVLRKADFISAVYKGRNKALYGVLMAITAIVIVALAFLIARREQQLKRSSSMQPLGERI